VRSLRARLFLAHAVVVLAAIAAVTFVEARLERRWLIRRNGEDLARASRLVASELAAAAAAGRYDWPALAAAADSASRCRVTLIASDGRVVADSRADATTLENHAGRPEIRAAARGAEGTAVRHSHTLGVDLQYAAVPAPPGLPFSVVRLAEPLDIVRALDHPLLRVSAIAALATLLVVFLVAYWLSGLQAARVAELQRVAGRIGAGETDARALEQPDDEVGRLGASLNRMAGELRARLEALQNERDEREHVLAHMTDGMALVDAQDRLVYANHNLAAILGEPGSPKPGTPLPAFARAPELADLVSLARSGGRHVESDLRLWAPRPRFVRASATPIDTRLGGAVLLVLHDLTEVEDANRMRQDFVANVSHELRTPLTSLRGYAETLLDGGLEDAGNREAFVRVIRDQADRLGALVDDLLSLAELERAGAPLRRARFDLREMLAGQVAAYQEAAARASLALSLEPGEPVEIDGDRARLEQVAANLLDNALKYTERGGVTVRTGRREGIAWCEVADTGTGIPLADQPRVFERFYRVEKARSRGKGGTGLGLSIVKHIIALHGGTVALQSVPGEGSTFRFELPPAAPGVSGR
jgi:two-component system phosphate regulon sensor histidine kinase PhoR